MVTIRADVPEKYSILYRSCIDDNGFVDVERFIEGLEGVKFARADIEGQVSGILAMQSERSFIIIVDDNESAERQRFTAAHELGHYFLHRDLLQVGGKIEDRYFLKADGVSDEKEKEANEFASAFLMPLDMILKAAESGKKTVGSLAENFGVSIIAMANRLQLPT